MRRLRISHFLAGTAVALALAASGGAFATSDTLGPPDETTVPEAAATRAPAPTAPAKFEPAAAKPEATVTTRATAPIDNPAPAVATPQPPQPAASAPTLTGKDLVKAPIATTLAEADVSVAEKLRDLLATRGDRLFLRKPERAAVEAFYRDRGFAPLWIAKGAPSARANAAVAHLMAAEADGLDPADYPVSVVKAGAEPDALADAELKLTSSVLAYARHAQLGRVHHSRISADISYSQIAPDPADILAKMADASSVGEALAAYNPPHEAYKALRAKLAAARAGKTDAGGVRIPSGPVLKVGMQDPRVPALRERLGIVAETDSTTFDKALSDEVKKFQSQRQIAASGQLTAATVDALNGPRRDNAVDIIIANMERWRWVPRILGTNHVVVNIPDYMLRVYRDGGEYWSTRVVVGQPKTPTPLISEMISFITVNPTWNVPPSIVNNEYLPALRQDSSVLDRMGLKVVHNRDGSVHIYQPPGERNALGRIRFNFPNKFLVYQHDTPDKHLFAHEKRAYSHGCMRVLDPAKYGEVLLSLTQPKEGYTAERLKKMFGNSEIQINLATHVPVHLTYQTAFVDEAGKLQIREDIYGRDARIIAALKTEDRKIADVPIERREASYTRPKMPTGFGGFGGGPGNFFERLFAPPPSRPSAPVGRRAAR